MELRKAKIGFIGCGGHSTRSLYPCIPAIGEIDLVAVCDLKPELAQRNARNFGARRWYVDFEKMIAEEELDGVMICGSPQMHTEVGKRCLEKGLPIFVEKPPALNVKEAAKLAQVARENGKWGMVGFMKRFASGYRLAKEIVQRPEFGRITLIEAKFSNGPYPSIWGLESAGLSYLIGQAVHIFDLIRHFAGEVKQVYANFLQIAETKHGFVVNIVFESGALGTLNLNSFESWDNFSERLCISGDEHYLIVDDMLYLHYHPKQPWISLADHRVNNLSQNWQPTGPTAMKSEYLLGYFGEISQFAKSILTGTEPRPNLKDGMEALRISEAIWESVSKNTVIAI